MSPLRQVLADYLVLRRTLGFKLQRAEKLLARFLAYVEHCGETHLRVSTMLAWAVQPGRDTAKGSARSRRTAMPRPHPAHDRPGRGSVARSRASLKRFGRRSATQPAGTGTTHGCGRG